MLQKNPPPTLQICFANFRMCSASRQKTRFARYAPGEIKLLGNRAGGQNMVRRTNTHPCLVGMGNGVFYYMVD